MITPSAVDEISGPRAAELARITYRQLDYWARQGWVTPSVEPGKGRPGRRIYGPPDVIKLAALGHFGRSGADVGRLGPQLCGLELPGLDQDYLLVCLADGAAETQVQVVAGKDLRPRVAAAGAHFVFDPAALCHRLAGTQPGAGTARRSA